MPALKKKTPELYNETKSSVGSFAFMATTYVARYCKYHFINFTIKPCLSFTVVSYALKFSEFGMDGADRCVCAQACFNLHKEIVQDFEDDSWREEGTTGVWFALGM